ncbi:MAG: 16S rRNA (uracil(1498)-N(3))-methyltransferase [Pseudohongiellaceae bacterium]
MRLTRVYSPEPLTSGKHLNLSKDLSHYLANVLRLKAGDAVALFNAECGEFHAVISDVRKNALAVTLGEQQRAALTPEQRTVRLELGLGLSKGDRMDYGIQKSVELGVTLITPVNCEYGDVRFKQASRIENKLRHWRRIAVSAAEQSGRLDVPTIAEPLDLADWLGQQSAETRLCLDPRGAERLGDTPLSRSIALLIGPEGGLSPAEVTRCAEATFIPTTLGPRVLRTETAPVAALAVIQHCLGL